MTERHEFGLAICACKSIEMRCDNLESNRGESDRNEILDGRINKLRWRRRKLSLLSLSTLLCIASILFAITLNSQTAFASHLVDNDEQSASHLLFRRQASADEENLETTTAQPASTTTDQPSVLAALADAATTSPPSTTTTQPTSTTTVSAGSGPVGKSKIPPVNFTQVNELFEAVFDDSEVVARWQHMDKQLTDGKWRQTC